MTVARAQTRTALDDARTALENARHLLRTDGEWWASADVEQALGLVRQALAQLGDDPSDHLTSSD